MKMISLKCPECGAVLSAEEDRNQMFCSYCGAKIIITNENEHIYRHIDEGQIKEAEAQIKKAEVEQSIQLKRLDIIERKQAASEKAKKIKTIIQIIMGIVGIVLEFAFFRGMDEAFGVVGLLLLVGVSWMWIASIPGDNKEDDIDFDDKVKVPSSISGYENKNYSTIEALFISAGFTNVKCVPLGDLTVGLFKKAGAVEAISINGKEITSGGKKYPPDAFVVITYHSFPEK